MADLGNATARERKETVMPGSMMEMATSLDQLKCGDQSLEEREYLLAFKPPAAIIRKRPHHKDTVLSANISGKSLLKASWSNEEQEDNMKKQRKKKTTTSNDTKRKDRTKK
mmetsp:Transcript_29728/g.56683  ORF Transcript_29728/g.56683 Transcript_29728/m.56683 type:complete len:111 (+) Transcript_29728:1148-1480(+)